MKFDALTKDQCEQVRRWRNIDTSILRTSFVLTCKMQNEFYENVICNRKSNDRYWAIIENDCFIGMVGLINISLENRNAEISIIIDPELKRKGFGRKALMMLLEEGFFTLNLDNIYAETYKCNPDLNFWIKMIDVYNCYNVELPNRKFSNGSYWNSIYINFERK